MRASTELLNDVSALIDFSEGDLRRLVSTWRINGKCRHRLPPVGYRILANKDFEKVFRPRLYRSFVHDGLHVHHRGSDASRQGKFMNTIASSFEVAGMVEEIRLIRLEMMNFYAIFAKIESKVRVSHHFEELTPESCPS
jgi:hypothetical protein